MSIAWSGWRSRWSRAWHALPSPAAQACAEKKRTISCVISSGKLSPNTPRVLKCAPREYVHSVVFSSQRGAVMHRTPICSDSNDTAGAACAPSHRLTCRAAEESAKWESAKWESAKWDQAKWDQAKWDQAKWDQARWDQARSAARATVAAFLARGWSSAAGRQACASEYR